MDYWSSRATARVSEQATGPGRGALVAAAGDLAGVRAPDGGLVPPERLGIGLVQGREQDGSLLVQWLDAGFSTWVAPDEVEPFAAGRHVVTVERCDRHGHHSLLRRCVAPLEHHWTVELRPERIIRAVRADGPCWTFTINPLSHEVDPPWLESLSDEAAEAIVAADTAVKVMHPPRRPFWRHGLLRLL